MIIVNGKELTVETFPNGESLIRTGFDFTGLKKVFITLSYEDDRDLINLMFLKKHLDDRMVGKERIKLILRVLYMPYSRMDRVEKGSYRVFTLKHIADFINDLNFDSVRVHEPHSDVTPALLNRCVVIDKTLQLTEMLINELDFRGKDDYIVFPDATADKRYNHKLKWRNTLTCNKHRDFETGKIESLDISGKKPTKPFRAIIVDDLCSRGGTFMLTAQKLKEMGATEIHLVVTHCEDSIHDGDILKTNLINCVHTTNSILVNTEHEKLSVADTINNINSDRCQL